MAILSFWIMYRSRWQGLSSSRNDRTTSSPAGGDREGDLCIARFAELKATVARGAGSAETRRLRRRIKRAKSITEEPNRLRVRRIRSPAIRPRARRKARKGKG